MDVWEVPQSSRSGLDGGFLMDVGPKRDSPGRRDAVRTFSGRDQGAGVAVTYRSHTDRARREINIPGHKFQGRQTFLMREPEKPVGRTQINLFRFYTVSHSKVGFRAALVPGMWLRPHSARAVIAGPSDLPLAEAWRHATAGTGSTEAPT